LQAIYQNQNQQRGALSREADPQDLNVNVFVVATYAWRFSFGGALAVRRIATSRGR
jgi:hypothetical protein